MIQKRTIRPRSRFWELAPTFLALLFAAAAPWSIAVAESSVVAGAVLLLAGLAAGKTSYLRPPRTLLVLLAFLGAQALSIPFAVYPARSLSCFKGSWVHLFPFVFWGWLASAETRRKSLAVLAGSAALAGLYGVVQHFIGWDVTHHRALENYGGGGYVAVGALSSHLTYSGVLLPVFFVAFSAVFLSGRRLWWAVAALLIGLALLFSFSRTAWIGAAAGLLALALWRGRRPFLITALALLALAVAASAIEPALRHRLLSIFAIENDPRSRLWRTALLIFADHPWLGAGLGAFKPLFPVYKVPGEYIATMHAHNDFLNVLVETGVVGALCWLAVWVAFFLEARWPVAAGGTGTRAGTPWLGFGLRAGVLALLVAGLGQCFFTDEEVVEVWWFAVIAALHEARAIRLDSGDFSSARQTAGPRAAGDPAAVPPS